jgi:ribosomal protein S25
MGRKKKLAPKAKDKKKKKKWTLKKHTPPKPKSSVLEEDDIVGLPAMELGADLSESTVEVSDDEVIEEVEVVSGGADSLESIEDSETFSLGGSADDGGQLETIRSNPKPKQGWSDKTKPQFSPGDLVVPIELTKKEALEFEPYKIICPHVQVESYTIRKSRILSESSI